LFSVGSFVAHAFTRAIKKSALKSDVYIRLSLLDPFTSKGLIGVLFNAKYGQREFGKSSYVDFCEHYLNRDDQVPSTNEPLPFAVTYDVTNAKSRDLYTPQPGDSMHSWPVAYLSSVWKTDIDPVRKTLRNPTHNDFPELARGNIIYVS